jgi:hypothetical protein
MSSTLKTKECIMNAETKEFLKDLESRGFVTSPVRQSLSLNPCLYKHEGDTILTGDMVVCIWGGSDQGKGLGCVTFFIDAKIKEKRRRTVECYEFMKQVNIFKTANEAIQSFDQWRKMSVAVRHGYKQIM